MKRLILLIIALIASASLMCAKQEYTVIITLTNPQEIAVTYGGYYMIQSAAEQIPMTGHTPGQYVFTMKDGDMVSGVYFKDTSMNYDTLRFQLIANTELEIDTFHTTSDTVEFEYSAQ